ncbi:T9SS type A sorting domain-containing protein [candidate division KSB1 bacterium]|nr:T9SS type A sorting domain-containing protein [candidate division KSB1 bacterium]
MNRSRTIFTALAVLMMAVSCLATEYAFMGFDVATQMMTAYVRTDQGTFHANVYMDQSNPGGAIGYYNGYADNVDEFYCDADLSPWDPNRTFHVPDGEINVISTIIQLLDADYNPVGAPIEVNDTLVANLDEQSQSGWYTYRQGDCTPVLPDTIRINSSFCATICHGTYSIPIYCEAEGYDPNLVQVTVTNGCDPNETHCDDPNCPRVDTSLFTYRIRVFPGCRIFLVMTYCGEGPGCVCIWRSDFVLPVEMAGFDAVAGDRSVTLNWATGSEINTNQFVISRSTSSAPEAVFEEVYRGEAAGNSTTARNYNWTDNNVVNGVTYYYKLNWVDANGNHVYHEGGVAVVKSATPQSGLVGSYALAQNFPNPFNSQTSFSFSILNTERVSLKVFDLLGREVATVLDRNMDAGVHTINWSAEGLATGLYMYTLNAGTFSDTKKFVYMK